LGLEGAGIFLWDGNYYALAVTEWLGVEESDGMVRVGNPQLDRCCNQKDKMRPT
jgi:hypothetical protein